MVSKLRIAMLISGGGSTMQAILRAVKSGFLSHIEPALVISSNPKAEGIHKALAGGMFSRDVLTMQPKEYTSAEVFGKAIVRECMERGVDFIGQYGWMVKTPTNVIETYPGMMVNQHPGPLDPGHPDFEGQEMFGRRVHCARIIFVRRTARPDQRDPKNDEYWKHHFTEATCQRVAPEYDKGVLLAYTTIPISPDDTVETLHAKVLPQEHMIQIETLKRFSEGTVEEISRSDRLVPLKDVGILEDAKRIAKILYPHG